MGGGQEKKDGRREKKGDKITGGVDKKPKKGSGGVGFLERLSKREKKVVTQPFTKSAGPSWREYYGTSPPTLRRTDSEIEPSKVK